MRLILPWCSAALLSLLVSFQARADYASSAAAAQAAVRAGVPDPLETTCHGYPISYHPDYSVVTGDSLGAGSNKLCGLASVSGTTPGGSCSATFGLGGSYCVAWDGLPAPACSTSDPKLSGYYWQGALSSNVCVSSCSYEASGVSLCTADGGCYGDLSPRGVSCSFAPDEISGSTSPSSGLALSIDPPPGAGSETGGPTPSGGGSSSPPASSGSSDVASFCTDNPTASICQSGSVSGACATFKCTGDPVQCQQAAALEAIRCAGLVSAPDASVAGSITALFTSGPGASLDELQGKVEGGADDPGFDLLSSLPFSGMFPSTGSCSDYTISLPRSISLVIPMHLATEYNLPTLVGWVFDVLTFLTLVYLLLRRVS